MPVLLKEARLLNLPPLKEAWSPCQSCLKRRGFYACPVQGGMAPVSFPAEGGVASAPVLLREAWPRSC